MRRHARCAHPKFTRGFTLLEAILVAVILGIVAVGIGQVQSRLFASQSTVLNLQVRTALMQECAELVIGTRRFDTSQNGFENGVTSTVCAGMTVPTGYAVPTVAIASYSGASCPANLSCETVTISSSGMPSIALMLVDY